MTPAVATPTAPTAAGTPVISRDGRLRGKLLGGRRPCKEKGCTGTTVSIRWENNQVTEPCDTAMTWDPNNQRLTATTPTDDTLAALARIVLAHYPEALVSHAQNLSLHTGLTEDQVSQALLAAQEIAGSHQSGPSSLERHQTDPATYIIRPETSAYVEVHDPNRPGHGYSVSIHADSDGPGIEVWPLTPNPNRIPDDEEPLDRLDWDFSILNTILENHY